MQVHSVPFGEGILEQPATAISEDFLPGRSAQPDLELLLETEANFLDLRRQEVSDSL